MSRRLTEKLGISKSARAALVILFALVLFTGAASLLKFDSKTLASSSQNLSGYAWNDNIGWISFNCTNTSSCASIDYGVNVDTTTRNMSGYAWSDNVGWISFNEIGGCPEVGCTTQPSVSVSGPVTGWAKVLSAGGGWDGWIKLNGASFSGSTASGYSWGSDVIGWVSWGGTGGGNVVSSVSLTNQAPTASITIPTTDIVVYSNQQVYFEGAGSDPDGTIAAYEWRESNCSTGTLVSSASSFSQTWSAGAHVVYLRVQDNQSSWSANCPSRTVTSSVPPPINGVCGSANGVSTGVKPTSGLCDSGTSSEVLPATGPGPWTWSCIGSNGGTTASCSAATSCGDGICNSNKGETPSTCRLDCKPKFEEF
ncbi:MAG: hypothetical protein AAB355_01445 [Patescibacteria group bacterium]